MNNKKSKIKTALAFVLLLAVCVAAVTLDLLDKGSDVAPTEDTDIMLYGEAHGAKAYYDTELKLWQDCYTDGCRNLFVELPYYSAEFLNVWMKEASNDLLELWFDEISGTLSGNEHYYHFLCALKQSCPETVFYGTDVGHQYDTTGARYLQYLEDNGQKASESYALAEDCIRQGKAYYESDDRQNGVSELREAYMVANFESAYKRCGGGRIMGIYGSYHTDPNAPDVMLGRLKASLGTSISSVKISSVMLSSQEPYQIGFCISGPVFLAMLLVPNFIWACGKKPDGYKQAQMRENKALLAFERIGEVLTSAALLLFPSVEPLVIQLPDGIYFRWNLLLWLAALVLMLLYECNWIRYFKGPHTMKSMYASFAGFPVAGATLPVIAVLLLGIYSRNAIVLLSAVVFGIGHIGIHIAHRREADLAWEVPDVGVAGKEHAEPSKSSNKLGG